RVEATRLRRALARYYSGPGAGDDVLIEIPLGGYVPAFSRRLIPQAETKTAPRSMAWMQEWRNLVPPRRIGVTALLVVAAVLAAVVFWGGGITRPLVAESVPASGVAAAPFAGNGLPTLLVNTFDTVGTPGPQSIAAAALRAKLTDAFSRFDSINVTSELQPGH